MRWNGLNALNEPIDGSLEIWLGDTRGEFENVEPAWANLAEAIENWIA